MKLQVEVMIELKKNFKRDIIKNYEHAELKFSH